MPMLSWQSCNDTLWCQRPCHICQRCLARRPLVQHFPTMTQEDVLHSSLKSLIGSCFHRTCFIPSEIWIFPGHRGYSVHDVPVGNHWSLSQSNGRQTNGALIGKCKALHCTRSRTMARRPHWLWSKKPKTKCVERSTSFHPLHSPQLHAGPQKRIDWFFRTPHEATNVINHKLSRKIRLLQTTKVIVTYTCNLQPHLLIYPNAPRHAPCFFMELLGWFDLHLQWTETSSFGRQSQLRELEVAEWLLDSVSMASANICLNICQYMCKVLPIVTPTIYLRIYTYIPSSITMLLCHMWFGL